MNKWIICATIAMTSFITSIRAEMYKPKTATLKNGLQVVLVENHLAPVVSVNLMYKVGTADDPPSMVGLSHFLEHLMFKGTKKVPNGVFKQKIISKGGMVNAYTTQDYTTYVCDIAVEHLPMVLEIEADRMVNLIFDEKETKAEQNVVMEERRMRMDNNPLGQAFEALLKNLFWYHPYGVPPIGYPHHIEAYTNEASERHYRTWYVPNNAVLIVSGDITMETLMPLVEKNFSSIPSRPLPKRDRPQEPIHKGVTQEVTVSSPRVSFTSFSWYYPTPSFTSDKESYYPLTVLAHILGGNSISRLYANLVDNRQLAIEASADIDFTLDPRYITISATLHPGVQENTLIQAVESHLADIVAKGISEEELKAAKRDLLADLAFSKDGNKGPLNAFANLAYNLSVEEIEEYPSRINSVTLEQVNKVAQKFLKDIPTLKLKIYPDKNAGQEMPEATTDKINLNEQIQVN